VFRAIGTARERTERLTANIQELLVTDDKKGGTLAQLNRRLKETAEVWQRLWRCMTVDWGPWSLIRCAERHEWKRDPFLSRGLYPSKIWVTVGEQTDTNLLRSLSQWFGGGVMGGEVGEFQGEIVKLTKVVACWVSLGSDMIRIRYETGRLRDLPFTRIARVLHRTRFGQPSAIEVFPIFGNSVFVNFPDQNSWNILAQLKTRSSALIVQTTPNSEFFATMKITEAWVNREMTNFDYLLQLNMFSGRSFNDVTQYPIFPWVLCDYSSESLNQMNAKVYRDLRKSMAADSSQRLNETVTNNFKTHEDGFRFPRYWLTSGDVRRFLSNCGFFSGGGFDSIESAFHTASHSKDSYSEVIPEFYFMAEMFASNVQLPKWANHSPTDFVYQNRQALESPLVNQSLHEWIDMIWGVRQTGRDSELALNAFRPELYPDYLPPHSKDIASLLSCNGIVPSPLFGCRHPPRNRPDLTRPLSLADIAVTVALSTGGALCYAHITHEEGLTFRIHSVEDSGTIVDISVTFTKSVHRARAVDDCPPRDVLGEGRRTRISNFTDFVRPLRPSFFALFSRSLAICDGQHSWFAVVDTDTGARRDLTCHDSDVVCASVSGDWLVTAGRDSMLNVFRKESAAPLYCVPLYHDEITCCEVSAAFGIIASGTRDGFLILSSLAKGSTACVVDLRGCRPYALSVTRGWGFVAVASTKLEGGGLQHRIDVYSVNGLVVRQREAPAPIAAWTTWTSDDGFDFLIVAGEQGKMWVGEVWSLELTQVKGVIIPPPVIAIQGAPQAGGFIVVSGKGEAAFVLLRV
jgi:hypothetical protein